MDDLLLIDLTWATSMQGVVLSSEHMHVVVVLELLGVPQRALVLKLDNHLVRL